MINKRKWAIAATAAAVASAVHAGDVNFSGFLTVAGGLVDDANSVSYAGYSEDDLTFDAGTLLGIQVTAQVSDRLTATAQLVARGNDEYSISAEWAYLSWQATDSSKIRFGRLRTPLYMYSDYVDVGYAYSWIRTPREVYYLPFNNIQGVDFFTTGTLGSFDTSLQVYYGAFTDEFTPPGATAPAQTKSRDQMGLAASFGQDWWSFRAAYHVTKLTVDVRGIPLSSTATIGSFTDGMRNPAFPSSLGFSQAADNLLAEEDDAAFMGLGFSIDTGTFVLAAEHVEFDFENNLFSKDVREYLMVGFRAGDWMFHLTGSRSEDEISHPEAGIPGNVAIPVFGSTNTVIGTLRAIATAQVEEREVVSIGARWDFTTSAALKFQLDDIEDSSPQFGGATQDQKVFAIAVQTVF